VKRKNKGIRIDDLRSAISDLRFSPIHAGFWKKRYWQNRPRSGSNTSNPGWRNRSASAGIATRGAEGNSQNRPETGSFLQLKSNRGPKTQSGLAGRPSNYQRFTLTL